LGQRFATKLWNATRFALGYLSQEFPDAAKPTHGGAWALSLADRWVLARTADAVAAADKALSDYDFHRYATGLYEFVWNEVCDWYIEAIKPVMGTPGSEGAASRKTLAAVLDVSLRLLHPVMPFITERLWEALNDAVPHDRGVPGLRLPANELLVKARWPELDASHPLRDEEGDRDFEQIRGIVKAVREVRAQYKVAPSRTLEVSVKVPAAVLNRLMSHRHFAETLANYKARDIGPGVEKPANAAVTMVGDAVIYLHDIVDVDAERKRLTKALDDKVKQLANFEKRLSNEKYVSSAPAHLVQETRDQQAAALREAEALRGQLAELG
jgi:valyl-tRNA synthetase